MHTVSTQSLRKVYQREDLMSIKLKLLLSIGINFIVLFTIFVVVIITTQSSKKNAELAIKIENTSTLIAMTNVSSLWNFDQAGMEQNLTSFLKDKDITRIEIKNVQGTSVIKKENPQIGKLIIKQIDMLHDSDKIGAAEIAFTDYYINRDVGEIAGLVLISGLILLLLTAVGMILTTNLTIKPITKLTETATRIAKGEIELQAETKGHDEVTSLGHSFNSMTAQLKARMQGFREMNETLAMIVSAAKEIVVSLNSSSREIEAAAQEQTSASNEHASGITEVSATLQELTITAKQITNNVGELVYSSEETVKLLKDSEKQLLETVAQLDDVGMISKNNTTQINELGKRSVLINEMVELIKEVANKTNILSINASIEASRSGEAGAGFSVVAAEIRELSKETIESAKKADIAAKEIKDFLNSIIISSENESGKVIGSGKTVKSVYDNMGNIVSKINNNYSFSQKIDVSIKQQENGSVQAAETMRQMAEIARQSAETARQTLSAAKDIVSFSIELEKTVNKAKVEDKAR
jgi:methyl-accepting chemotaxis protein